MRYFCKRAAAFLVVLIISVSALPLTANAEASDYVTVSRNKSYNADGKHWTSYNVEELTNNYSLEVIGEYLSPSGKALKTFTNSIEPGKEYKLDYDMSFSGLASGTYSFRLTVKQTAGLYGTTATWTWKNNITHKAPAATIEYESYENYYNDKGRLMHKINIVCINLKGQRLYCKIYDSDGYLVYDFGSDSPARKSNDEIGWFAWSGVTDGTIYPSGNYTFVISNSANNKVIQETIWLTIPQGGNG